MNGFTTCRTTSDEEWLLHSRTPAAVVQTIMRMDMPPFKTATAHSAANLSNLRGPGD
jgi:hypothetical protein